MIFETWNLNRHTYLLFSTSTTLEISSGALPDLLSNILPASLWRASNLIDLSNPSQQNINKTEKWYFHTQIQQQIIWLTKFKYLVNAIQLMDNENNNVKENQG